VSFPLPEVPSSFAQLQGLDRERLQKLDQDVVAFSALLHDLDSVKTLRSMREETIQENARIARETLDKREELEALQSEVLVSRLELQELETEFQTKLQSQLAQDSEKLSQAGIYEALRTSAAEADEKSEDLLTQFQDEDLGMAEFLKSYLELRKLYHRRTAAIEYGHRWIT